ncbi:MAG: hypothetical protein GY723_21985 [bacterium]|nr:hypothetical protein [bacterium]
MKSRGRIALGLIVLAVGAAIAGWWLLRVAPIAGWWLLRPAPRSVFFAEIRFDQGFAALSPDAAPFSPGLVNGFRFQLEESRLHSANGEAQARGDLAVGLGWYRPDAHPPRQLGQMLVVTEGPTFSWTEPGGALRAKSDRFSWLAEPRVVELVRRPEGCTVSVGDESLLVPIGASARSKPRVRELTVDSALRTLRAAMPGLPEPSAAMRTVLELRLDPDGDGRVEVHEAYTITCHGQVDLHPDDLLIQLRRAEAALSEGDAETAATLHAALAAIDPRDPVVRALERWIAPAPEDQRELLTGIVELPTSASPDLIAEVTLWPAGKGPEAAMAQVPAIGGDFQVLLPRGEYQLQCRIPGHEPVRVRTKVPPEAEVRCALR